MSDPIDQLCQLVAERVQAHPTAEPSALAAQVREAIATDPQHPCHCGDGTFN